jgi:import inner membrane translocase subunit TIM21
MLSVTRAAPLLSLPSSIRPLIAVRLYATQTGLGTSSSAPQPRRKAVTAFNDDGRVPWGNLSPMEKAARTTQQSFNFGLIVVGAILTVSLNTSKDNSTVSNSF